MQKIIADAKNVSLDIPVSACIVKDDEIISLRHNEKEKKQNALFHAEILAINEACQKLNSWRLDNCDMYVTLEPCPMCAAAIIQARIKNLYFGSFDNLYGALGSKFDMRDFLNSSLNVKGGMCENVCDEILERYFKNLRNAKK